MLNIIVFYESKMIKKHSNVCISISWNYEVKFHENLIIGNYFIVDIIKIVILYKNTNYAAITIIK